MTDCSYVNNMIKEKYKLRDSIIPTIFSSIIYSQKENYIRYFLLDDCINVYR